ncbi:MAG: AraC family transcriptional regulator [Clostridia bacterium]|nr:AraC family transcriptional regulator [Clostridia bacterium]
MLYKKVKHFSALVGIDVHLFDVKLKVFEHFGHTFCSRCPKQCDYRNTHLYGCYESVRWDNKYIYYCPMDFIFVAVPVMGEYDIPESGVIVGPILMGDPADFEKTYALPYMETARVNDLAEVTSALFSSAPRERMQSTGEFLNAIYRELELLPAGNEYPIDLEKRLQAAIVDGDEVHAREYLNRLLGEIFFRSNGDLAVIKARVLELLVLLSRSAIEGGADTAQIFAMNNDYIRELDRFGSVEKLSQWLSGIINRFISYMFEFGDIKHSVTIHKITGYIRNNYMNKITLDDIAEHVYMSKSHISKIFNAEIGMSISAYINGVRVEKGKRLLQDVSLTIAEIANLTGFEDQSYFSKQFKAITGVSPKKFREKAQ